MKVITAQNYKRQDSKVKVKCALEYNHEGPEGQYSYSYTLSLTSVLDVGGWLTPTPTALPLGMTRYPLYRTIDAPQEQSGRVRKTSPPPGFDPRTVQFVASRCTD